jgi:hypothetical protein
VAEKANVLVHNSPTLPKSGKNPVRNFGKIEHNRALLLAYGG